MTLKIKRTTEVVDRQSFDISISSTTYESSIPGDNMCYSPLAQESNFEYNPNLSMVLNGSYAINTNIAAQIQRVLNSDEDVILSYNQDVNINSNISWHSNSNLVIKSQFSINLLGKTIISNFGNGTIRLMAGIENKIENSAAVNFVESAGIHSPNGGAVKIYYNPVSSDEKHKYQNPSDVYSHVYPPESLTAFMFVNSIEDLRDIKHCLYCNFALSQNITGNNMSNFSPLGNNSRAFSGNFDGLGYEISSITIQGENQMAIFGLAVGTPYKKVNINSFSLKNISVQGSSYLGIVVAEGQFIELHDIIFKSDNIASGFSIIGGLIGSGSGIVINNISYDGPDSFKVFGQEYTGQVAGALRDSDLTIHGVCDSECIGFQL